MNNYVLLHNHSFYSLLDSASSPKSMTERAKSLGMKSIAITDHGSLSGIIKFYEECKKNDIKPILGIELYVSKQDSSIKEKENSRHNHLIVLAKNFEGYKDLIKMSNMAAYDFYRNPRLSYDKIKEVAKKGNLIGMSACIAGVIAEELFTDSREAFSKNTEEEVREFLKEDWLEVGVELNKKWKKAFKGNWFLEMQDEGLAAQKVVKECIREISKKTKTPAVPSCDAHFSNPEDSFAHEIMICSNTRDTMESREEKRARGEDILFSDNATYYIKSYDEMLDAFTEEELNNTLLVDDLIEKFHIETKKPRIPEFPIPNGFRDINDFVYKTCIKRLKEIGKYDSKEYLDRFEFEYKIFSETEINNVCLNNYFAILWDIVKYVESLGSKCGVGRGSAAGCITSYLLGITRLDPVEHKLSFQRFFNTGRLSKDNVSLPDIDLDVSAELRGKVIEHLKEMWGDNNVLQIATFGTLQPKAALKEVFRAKGVDFDIANAITRAFPDAEIKHDEDSSYTIEDAIKISDEFRDMVEPYKAEVELAKKLEGIIKSRGIHAAGVLISSEDVNNYLPITYDAKSKSFMCSLDMGDAEKFCVKVDILGLKLLSIFDDCVKKINETGDDFYVESLDFIEYNDNVEKDKSKEIKVNQSESNSKSKEKTVEDINLYDVVVKYFQRKEYNVTKNRITNKNYTMDVETGFDYIKAKKKGKTVHVYIEDDPRNIFGDRKGEICDYIDCTRHWAGDYYVFTMWKEVVFGFKTDDIINHNKENKIEILKIKEETGE